MPKIYTKKGNVIFYNYFAMFYKFRHILQNKCAIILPKLAKNPSRYKRKSKKGWGEKMDNIKFYKLKEIEHIMTYY